MDLVAGVHSLSEGSVANKLNLRNHIGVTVPSQLLVLIVGLNSSFLKNRYLYDLDLHAVCS